MLSFFDAGLQWCSELRKADEAPESEKKDEKEEKEKEEKEDGKEEETGDKEGETGKEDQSRSCRGYEVSCNFGNYAWGPKLLIHNIYI